jgi:murein tripeptide amidase MpaA
LDEFYPIKTAHKSKMNRLFFLCFLAVIVFAKQRYDNYQLVGVTFSSEEAQRFQTTFPDFDVWSNDGVIVADSETHLLLSPSQYDQFVSNFPSKSLSILNENIQSNIDMEDSINSKNNTAFFTKYHRYIEIENFLKTLATQHPSMVQLFNLGKSYEGRDTVGIRFGTPGAKKNVWLSSHQHAREWISSMTTLYIVQRMLTEFKAGNARVVKLFSRFNFHLVPVLNPDGYEYTHTNARMWRKNRRANGPPSGSFGVDMNRNWPIRWGGPGASTDPRSDTYMGTSPASEPETQNVIKYFNQTGFAAALDFHAYSQLLLRPWQWSSASCPDETKLNALGAKMVEAIRVNGAQTYRNIRGSQLYVHSGAMVDYFYGEKKILGYTVELRPTSSSSYGFVLPPQFIVPTGIENYFGVLDYFEHEH